MTIPEINQVLALIDAWVGTLPADQLNEQCRVSGRGFFAYMAARGVKANHLARLIIDATGYNPAQLWKASDAALLKDAIFRYEAAQAVTDINDDAKGNVQRFWS
jgi:hypothetical protein